MTNLQHLHEEWKDVPNYEGLYQVSSLGRVKSLSRNAYRSHCIRPMLVPERILKFIHSIDGRNLVMLYKRGIKRKVFGVSDLVFFTFNPDVKKVDGFEIDHDDNNKINNALYNLKYITGRENSTKRSLNLKKTSKYTGVSWDTERGKWQSHIRYNGGSFYLGRYEIEEDAAEAYKKALLEIEAGTFKRRERIKPLTSRYKGVSFNSRHNKWIAFYKRKYLGLFITEEEAAKACEEALKQLENKAA